MRQICLPLDNEINIMHTEVETPFVRWEYFWVICIALMETPFLSTLICCMSEYKTDKFSEPGAVIWGAQNCTITQMSVGLHWKCVDNSELLVPSKWLQMMLKTTSLNLFLKSLYNGSEYLFFYEKWPQISPVIFLCCYTMLFEFTASRVHWST